jgi:hypothetical protein
MKTFTLQQRIRLGCALAGVLALLGLTAGCGGQPKAKVSGTVTLDGQPIENGTIMFYPKSGKGQSAGGAITNGKYNVEASVGEMSVAISASKVVGKQKMYDTPDSPVLDKVVEMLPAQYNTLTKLTATLKPGTNDNVNFDLTSGKEKKK